eukprot:gene9626-11797_t
MSNLETSVGDQSTTSSTDNNIDISASHDDDDIDLTATTSVTNNDDDADLNNTGDQDQSTGTETFDDPEIEEMKKKVRELEEEAKKLNDLQNQLEGNAGYSSADQEEIDARSIYVGNVDYKSTHDEILAYFQSCGTVNRITILNDKVTGHPKGCCYIEFVDKESIANAMVLNDTIFKERQIKILPKRTNLPMYMRFGSGGGGRGGRGGRGGGRGGFVPGVVRGGGAVRGAFRGRGRGKPNLYHPYA